MGVINILFLEDEEMDVLLIKKVLERSGMSFDITVASDKGAFVDALLANNFDVILADHSLPQFSAMEALQLIKEKNISKPFILVTGTVSEEFAVNAMKDGAWDYILKDRLQRLPAAIAGAMDRYRLESERQKILDEVITKEALLNEGERLAHFGSWQSDRINNTVYWSDELFRILGYMPGEITPSTESFLNSVHPDETEKVRAILAEAHRYLDRQNYECRIITKDGLIRHIYAELVMIRNEQKENIRLNGFMYDITDRKDAELKLIESEQKYRRLFEDNPLPFWVFDTLDFRILDVNNAAIRHYGYSREEFLSMTTMEIRPDDEKERYKNIDRTGKRGFNNNGIWKHLKKDGSIIYVEVSTDEIIFAGHNARLVLINDVTEKLKSDNKLKESEDQLKKSEANLRTIFDNTDTGYALLDQELKIISFNRPVQKFISQELHMNIADKTDAISYFHEDKYENIRQCLQNALQGNSSCYEASYPQADSPDKWYYTSYHPVLNTEKIIIGVIMAISDVTERKISDLQEKTITADLLQRNNDLEQFAYIISHNLRAPVANIIGVSNALLEGNLNEEDTKEFMEGLSTSIQKLDTVIIDLNNILQVKHKINEHKEKVSLSQIVNDIKFSISNFAGSDMVMIMTDFDEVDEISTLKSYIYSIFYNLISNSIKYRQADKTPVIEIRTQTTADKLEITFKDNSMGIDLEKKGDQVFGLYKRFHQHSAEGKGIGLFMVKTQVETLGGKISVRSQVNLGTEFKIEFEKQDLLNE